MHIPREANIRVDLLAQLASAKDPDLNRTVIQEILEIPSTETGEVMMLEDARG